MEGQHIAIEYRYAEAKRARILRRRLSWVRLKVDIIVVTGGNVLVQAMYISEVRELPDGPKWAYDAKLDALSLPGWQKWPSSALVSSQCAVHSPFPEIARAYAKRCKWTGGRERFTAVKGASTRIPES
jgi:hypothetical protein